MDTKQQQKSAAAKAQALESRQTGWDVFARTPKVEGFAAPELAKACEVLPCETAAFAEHLGE